MTIKSALAAINLVDKTVKPAFGTERWSRANGRPRVGRVVDVNIIDLAHPYVLVMFGKHAEYMYPHELQIVPA